MLCLIAKCGLVEFDSECTHTHGYMRSNAKLPRVISKKIKKRRGELDITQEELAEKVGVSRVYIGYVEQGRNTPSLEILEKIAKALKVKLSDLVG